MNQYACFTQEVKRAAINITGATSGVHAVVALDAAKRVRLLGYKIAATTACEITLQGATGGGQVDLSGPMAVGANGNLSEEPTPYGCVETAVGQGFSLKTSTTAKAGGYIQYLQW